MSKLTSNTTSLQEILNTINALPETNTGIDTSDATALPEDIVAGETAYVNGEKITGTMEEIAYIHEDAIEVQENQTKDTISVVSLNVDNPKRAVLYGAVIDVPKSEFGDAAPSDVAKGKTFTSISGLQVIGTNEDMEAPDLQNKTVNPSETVQTIKADTGYDGLNVVTVNAIDSAYVGSGVAQRTSSNLTASGATVSVPAGYYASAASKSVATATQATPSVSIDSAGKITATATQSAGYVSSGTKTGTKQLTTQAAKTITPSASEQTAVASGVYTTGEIKVAAIPTTTQATPSISVSSSGLITASATQTEGYVSAGTKSGTKQLTTQAAQTITPSTSNKTISSGIYLTGTQTIKGDTNLKAENIKSGVSIFGVNGSYEGSGGLDTSDATAVASDIAQGKTAYVNGQKIAGNVPVQSYVALDCVTIAKSIDGTQVVVYGEMLPEKTMIEQTAVISVDNAEFGNATAADVRQGKTFTSAAGLLALGAYVSDNPYSRSAIITWTPSSDTDVLSFNHPLVVVPDGFFVIAREDMSNMSGYILSVNMDVDMLYSGVYKFATGAAYVPSGSGIEGLLALIVDFENDITAQGVNLQFYSDRKFKAGATYEILVYKR